MRGLAQQVVVITGAAGAIGAATAARFIEEGARVVAVDIDAEAIGALTEAQPKLAAALRLDVTDADAVSETFDGITQQFGRLDVLINNAGINARYPFTEVPAEDWRRVMATNLDGAFFAAQAAARIMLEAGGGSIVHTASTNGLVGYRRHALYSAGKAALIELTRCMALDLAPRVRVNSVAPGYIATPLMTAGDEQAAGIPLGRFGAPEEVAALFAFLASADASYITGQTYVIDGGETAGGLLSGF